MKLSVIIPQYKHMDLLHQVLFDLYQYCRKSLDEVVVVDDGSHDLELEEYYQSGIMMSKLPIRVMMKMSNEGFLKACNFGIEKSEGDIVVLLSNDVRIREDIMAQAKTALQVYNYRAIVGNRLIDFDSGWNNFDGRIYQYLEGWFLACTREAWNDIGGFDERFGSSDYEDVDFSTSALNKGYQLYSLNNSKVRHIGGQSYGFNPKREERTEKNKIKFRAKWIK